jgi:hypothetical protein
MEKQDLIKKYEDKIHTNVERMLYEHLGGYLNNQLRKDNILLSEIITDLKSL